MSGGSYNYLCYADADDIHYKIPDITSMRDRLIELGYKDAAKETEGLILMIEAYQLRLETRLERLEDIWKAVEWCDSGDWGLEDIEEAIKEYREK